MAAVRASLQTTRVFVGYDNSDPHAIADRLADAVVARAPVAAAPGYQRRAGSDRNSKAAAAAAAPLAICQAKLAPAVPSKLPPTARR